MTLRIVPSNDDRNEVRRELDTAVRACHKNLGNTITGYVLLVWPEDKNDCVVAYHCGQIDPDFLSEFAKQAIVNDSIECLLE